MNPLVIVAGLQIAGQFMSNSAEAEAELTNAKFYAKQAELSRLSGERKELIAKRNYSTLRGQQKGVVASQNVALGGSITSIMADTLANEVEEIAAIQKQTKLDVELAMLREKAAQSKASLLSNPMYNLVQAGPALLSASSKSKEG